MSNNFSKDHTFTVWCGDTEHYFKEGQTRYWPNLRQIFRERLRQCPSCSRSYELFPGLVLEDVAGQKWKVQLQAQLVPIKLEEANAVEAQGPQDGVPDVWEGRPTFKKRKRSVQHPDQNPTKR